MRAAAAQVRRPAAAAASACTCATHAVVWNACSGNSEQNYFTCILCWNLAICLEYLQHPTKFMRREHNLITKECQNADKYLVH